MEPGAGTEGDCSQSYARNFTRIGYFGGPRGGFIFSYMTAYVQQRKKNCEETKSDLERDYMIAIVDDVSVSAQRPHRQRKSLRGS